MTREQQVRLLRALAGDLEAMVNAEAPDPTQTAAHLAMVAFILADLMEGLPTK